MKLNCNTIAIALLFIGSLMLQSCGNNTMNKSSNVPSNSSNNSTGNSDNSTGTNMSAQEQPKEVEIAGTYSGTDNVGMESTIVLRTGGGMAVQSSIGNGVPSQGRWSGTAANLSLYIETDQPFYDSYGNLRIGGSQLLGRATISEDGLQIKGGNFYIRK